ncbi:hypothetical protein SARC_04239 [Sphaeroforma arctica JP610]|uniref:Alpha-type protein kinase domain-containing protein n=1 Tax=Sphaeroforma arctica JP610 TaxID=667725 RepID=A0A0L0G5H7_9EUKA|nr:hypothetical protein SARC_04239 [Sphaeroforma arctica JP610]KNC83508.1 hypothetical protein SARC_04239 [Sphaeroforma arctica JP610]|eukprot:XP_014157410.1 hypothetical protein SARC_04239 [Sphaeroforma arctica JP610]
MMTTATSHGAQGAFNCGPSEALDYSFSSMVTPMTATKTHLQDWGDAELNSDYSRLYRISQKATSADDPKCECKRYLRKRDKLQKYLFIPHAKGPCRWEAVATPTGVEIQNGYFGVGAERIVKFMDVVDAAGNVVATPLVAKATKKESGHKQGRTFHIPFFMTQFTAQDQNVARDSFLGCCLCEYFNFDADEYQWVLCEKRLDRSKYRKWNDNGKYVRGFAEPLGHRQTQRKPSLLNQNRLIKDRRELFDINPDEDISETINDEADEEELRNRYRAQYKRRKTLRSFNDEGDTLSPQTDQCILSKELSTAPCDTWNDSESSYECLGPSAMLVDANPTILQAFTHYTYARSRRTLMVCDLQGVLDHTRTPAVFEFTDPWIHHRTTKPNQTHIGSKTRMGKRKAFGNTDLGRAGMRKVFLSHTCNAVCDILGIMEMKEIDKNTGELYVSAPGIDDKIENKIDDDF